MLTHFRDRSEAGQLLATKFTEYTARQDVLVLGLPRGGVIVAFEVAKRLRAPLDVFLVRKLGVPGHEELAMGAIATRGVCVLNDEVVQSLLIPSDVVDEVAKKERHELERREWLYRGGRPAPGMHGRTAMLVDDGLATGATMLAAVVALRELHPARIVVAVPVAAPQVCQQLGAEVDQIVCLLTPEPFYGVGYWYEDFSQTTDDEVHDLLEQAAHEQAATSPTQ